MNNQPTVPVIETPSLRLVPCEAAHLEAFMRDRLELGRMLGGVTVPDNWPTMPESLPHVYRHLQADAPSAIEWGFHLFVHKGDRALVGEGGFKGRPGAEGVVEIGYAIAPEYRRRGLAFEAARALTSKAFSHPEVRVVQAHTLPDGEASIRVLKKLGMKFMGKVVDDPEDGEVFLWRVERKDYLSF